MSHLSENEPAVPSLAPSVAIVVPVFNGGDNFRICLDSLLKLEPPPEEIFVVADGESDGSWRMVQAINNITVIALEETSGPAKARNIGALAASSEIVFFVDADVTVQPDCVAKIKQYFLNHPTVSAIMGSYDDSPSELNFLSQYKNLFHHYTHQNARLEATTFWSACGAIRTTSFRDLGGFDEQRFRPMDGGCPGTIEDIELGYRMSDAKLEIHLVKDLQVTHLKRWTVLSLLKTDFFYRALPWTKLLLRRKDIVADLNLHFSNRVSVILVFLLMLFLGAALGNLKLFLPALFCVVLLLIVNWRCYAFFLRKRGVWFSILVVPWHWLYYFYSGIAFLWGSFHYYTNRD